MAWPWGCTSPTTCGHDPWKCEEDLQEDKQQWFFILVSQDRSNKLYFEMSSLVLDSFEKEWKDVRKTSFNSLASRQIKPQFQNQ